jgi:protein tyrosine phosphatase (PTP) superfamily phosphohydrolase (DUF442 family)
MNPLQTKAFENEVALAVQLMRSGSRDDAFTHLERAHVLGQQSVRAHVLSHWLMLKIGFNRREPMAVFGQALRIVLGAAGSAVGVVPRGNTGGTDVSMFKSMAIDPQLSRVMQGDTPMDSSDSGALVATSGLDCTSPGAIRTQRLKKSLGLGGALIVGIVLGGALYAYAPTLIRTESTQPHLNFVAVSERIHTSGQPSEAQLGGLARGGYGLVINLAPPTTVGSIAQEGLLVAQTGLSYVNIPVDWHSPRYEDFELFSNILKQAGSRHVLVHCQVNKRASVFTFLYRVVHEGTAPDVAYENVTSVWVPDPQWKDFARAALKRHGIEFELY